MYIKRSNSGFTLIELLVVIAIIGLLASVVLVALNGARQKARVTKRAADLAQIQKALELYYNDNAHYPIASVWQSVCTGGGSWTVTTANNIIPGLVPTMGSMPVDPASSGVTANCYAYESNNSVNNSYGNNTAGGGADYKLIDYNLTDMTSAQVNQFPGLLDKARNGATTCNGIAVSGIDANQSWAIASPGLACQ